MSDCDDDNVDREQPDVAGGGLVITAPGEARLQSGIKDVPAITAREDVDEHTALTRGLAEYLWSITGSYAGRPLQMTRVAYDYPDRETQSDPSFPAAAVYATQQGTFSDLGHSTTTSADEVSPGIYVPNIDWFSIPEVMVEVECQDAAQRVAVRSMLRAAMRPVDWYAGFRLVLPYYHSALGSYSLVKAAMSDTPDLVASGIRLLTLVVQADVQTYEVRRLPKLAQARIPGTVGIVRGSSRRK